MKKIIVYLAITFAITWGLQIPVGISTGAFQTGITESVTMQLIVAVTMFAPLIAALIANRILPYEEPADLALRPCFKGNLRWYLFAWLVPAVLALAGAVVFFLVNPGLFDASMTYIFDTAKQAGVEIPDTNHSAIVAGTFVASLTYAPLVNMISAFGEEAGWRGMLYPALREQLETVPAALISGIIWGIWHAPVIIMGHNYGMAYEGYPWLGILAMILFCVGAGTVLAWLRDKSGTVWTCALYHGVVNAVANLALIFCATGATVWGPSTLGLIAGIPSLAFGLWCLLRTGAETTTNP